MSLLSPAEVKELVRTSASDTVLQHVIDREEREVVRLFGAHYVDSETTISETLAGGTRNLYLRRRIASISSIVEYQTLDATSGTTLTSGDYLLWANEGRIERMPATAVASWFAGGATWGAKVVVTYVPYDDDDDRRAAIIELVRLALERTAMRRESVAGEYSYEAPDWGEARAEILRRLGFVQP